jgi:hypothetical protein
MAWLNSDDMYLPGAFSVVAEIFSQHPQVEWLTTVTPVLWNEHSQATLNLRLPGFNRQAFFRGANFLGDAVYSKGCIQQESTFWRVHCGNAPGRTLMSRSRSPPILSCRPAFINTASFTESARCGEASAGAPVTFRGMLRNHMLCCRNQMVGSDMAPWDQVSRWDTRARSAFFSTGCPVLCFRSFCTPLESANISGRGGEWILKTELIA